MELVKVFGEGDRDGWMDDDCDFDFFFFVLLGFVSVSHKSKGDNQTPLCFLFG